jgi:hypothetical protein
VVWTVPVIETATAWAAAGTPSCACTNGKKLSRISYTVTPGGTPTPCATSPATPLTCPPACYNDPTVTSDCNGCASGHLSGITFSRSGSQVTFTIAPNGTGRRMIDGNTSCCGGGSLSADLLSITVTDCVGGSPYTVFLTYCC